MKVLFTFLTFILFSNIQAQEVSGSILLEEGIGYLSEIFVTNLNTQKTSLAHIDGSFTIKAKKNDVLRFTSYRTERKDVKVSDLILNKKHFLVPLMLKALIMKEVVISRFKPTGNIRIDSKKLQKKDKVRALKKVIGLPEPKKTTSNQLPVSFANGGFNIDIQSIYDLLSGEMKNKKRRMRYERMQNSISEIKKTLGEAYFIDKKIPKTLISNYLEFIYISEDSNMTTYNIKVLSEKYLPIYKERLKNSSLKN